MGLLINPYLLDGGASLSIGSANVVLATEGNYLSLTRMDDTHVIMCYRDVLNQIGRAVCLTVSGTTITAGTPVTFSVNNDVADITVISASSSKAVVAFRDLNNVNRGFAIVLSLSGTTITLGTRKVFETAQVNSNSLAFMDSTHVIVSYRYNAASGAARCLTISGTTLAVGVRATFDSAAVSHIGSVGMDSTHAIVCFRDPTTTNNGFAVCLTLSGTTVTAGTREVYSTGIAYPNIPARMDSTHAIVGFTDNEGTSKARLAVLTLSGTTITAEPSIFVEDYVGTVWIAGINSTQAVYNTKHDAFLVELDGVTATVGGATALAPNLSNSTVSVGVTSSKAICAYMDATAIEVVSKSISVV